MLRRYALLLLCLTFAPRPAFAIFHDIYIAEVFGGGGAAGDQAQYVVLQAWLSGQNLVNGHALLFYDSANAEVGRVTFAANVANGADQMTLFIATSAAAALFGLTPDKDMSAAFIDRRGGRICWNL